VPGCARVATDTHRLSGRGNRALGEGRRAPSDSEQSRDAVRSAARTTYAQIKSTAPGTKLIVVGQSWTSDNVPSNVTGLRDTLRAEAAAASAVFVDPLTDKWFVNDTGKLVGSDGVHLTDQGHKYLADQLQPRIAAALG